MKKLLVLSLIPMLSLYFVTIEDYEVKISELENRIEEIEIYLDDDNYEVETAYYEYEELNYTVVYQMEDLDTMKIISYEICWRDVCEEVATVPGIYDNMTREKLDQAFEDEIEQEYNRYLEFENFR